MVATESLRTLDRLRLRTHLADAELALGRQAILAIVASLELIEIDATVLDRAAQPTNPAGSTNQIRCFSREKVPAGILTAGGLSGFSLNGTQAALTLDAVAPTRAFAV